MQVRLGRLDMSQIERRKMVEIGLLRCYTIHYSPCVAYAFNSNLIYELILLVFYGSGRAQEQWVGLLWSARLPDMWHSQRTLRNFSQFSFSVFSVENLFFLSFLIRCYKFSFFFHSLHNFTDDVDGVLFSHVAHLSIATEHGMTERLWKLPAQSNRGRESEREKIEIEWTSARVSTRQS